MVAAAIGGLLIAIAGVVFVWLGREIGGGRIAPAMGGHTQDNTTPDSWRAMSQTVGTEVERCGWSWIVAAAVLLVFAPVAAAILLASSAILAVKVAMAATQLVPIGAAQD